MKTTAILTLCVLATAFALSIPSLRLASRDKATPPPLAERIAISPALPTSGKAASSRLPEVGEAARKDVERAVLVPLRERDERGIRFSAMSRVARPQPPLMDYAVDFEAAGPEGIGADAAWLTFTVRAASRHIAQAQPDASLPAVWTPVALGRWGRKDGAVLLLDAATGQWIPAAAHPLMRGF